MGPGFEKAIEKWPDYFGPRHASNGKGQAGFGEASPSKCQQMYFDAQAIPGCRAPEDPAGEVKP